jgi:hypothetical protein
VETGTKVISEGLHPGWFERFESSFALALDAFISALEGKEIAGPVTKVPATKKSLSAGGPFPSRVVVPITMWEAAMARWEM